MFLCLSVSVSLFLSLLLCLSLSLSLSLYLPNVKNYLLSCAVPRPWEYNVESSSDQSDEWTVEDVIREKLCLYLDKEIPYVIKQVSWKVIQL